MSERAMSAIRIDVVYALGQLREHRCIDRAVDALERVEEATEWWSLPTGMFDLIWNEMAAEGLCDGHGGGEYERVRSDWFTATGRDVLREFIRAHANATPSSRPDLFPSAEDADTCNLSQPLPPGMEGKP